MARQIYCIFTPVSATIVASVQVLVNGVPVFLNRTPLSTMALPAYQLSGINRQVTITASTDLTGIGNFILTGFNNGVGEIQETIAGGAAALTAANTYNRIDSVIFRLTAGQTIPGGTTVSVGLGNNADTIIPIDVYCLFQQVNAAAHVTGTIAYTLSQTLDNCIYPTDPYLNQIPYGSQYFEAITAMTAATTSQILPVNSLKLPIGGLKLTINGTGGGSLNFTILQQGGNK